MPVVTKTESPVSSAAAHLHWNACRKQWAGRFLNNPADAASGTWLWTDGSGTNIRFGCLLCNRFFHEGHVTALPNIASKKYVHCEKGFCKASNFARHEQSALHRAATPVPALPLHRCGSLPVISTLNSMTWKSQVSNLGRRLQAGVVGHRFGSKHAQSSMTLTMPLKHYTKQTEPASASCIADDAETLLARVCALHHGFQREPQLSNRWRDLLRTDRCHILTTDVPAARRNQTLPATPFLPHLQFVLNDKSHAARRTERQDLDLKFPNDELTAAEFARLNLDTGTTFLPDHPKSTRLVPLDWCHSESVKSATVRRKSERVWRQHHPHNTSMPVVTKTVSESSLSSAASHLQWNACRKRWANRFLNNPADAVNGDNHDLTMPLVTQSEALHDSVVTVSDDMDNVIDNVNDIDTVRVKSTLLALAGKGNQCWRCYDLTKELVDSVCRSWIADRQFQLALCLKLAHEFRIHQNDLFPLMSSGMQPMSLTRSPEHCQHSALWFQLKEPEGVQWLTIRWRSKNHGSVLTDSRPCTCKQSYALCVVHMAWPVLHPIPAGKQIFEIAITDFGKELKAKLCQLGAYVEDDNLASEIALEATASRITGKQR